MEENIIFSNTHGFQIKRKEICKFLKTNKPLAFMVAEHFQSKVEHLWVNGYDLAAQYCRGSRERGGVAIFVRNGVQYKPRPDLDRLSVNRQFETASVEVPSKNLILTVVYRSPQGSLKVFDSRLEDTLKLYNVEYFKKHVIAGDFNINKKYLNLAFNKTEQFLAQNGCKFKLSSSTHRDGGCLDNFIVDFETPEADVMADGFSDHRCIKLPLEKSNVKTFLDLKFDPWKSYRSPSRSVAVADDFVNEDDESDAVLAKLISRLESPQFRGVSKTSTAVNFDSDVFKLLEEALKL